jgi:hypothetical protein
MAIKEIKADEGTILVTRTVLGTPTVKEEKIPIRPFVTDTMMVGVKVGRTINIGNYENIKVDVLISCPCYKEEVRQVYLQISEMAKDLIVNEIEELMDEQGRQGSSKA